MTEKKSEVCLCICAIFEPFSVLEVCQKCHPIVLFTVIDSYERLNADSRRVIGILLGSVDKGVVEVTNCFCVPNKEQDDLMEVKFPYAEDMDILNRQVFVKEVIVGWWATGNKVTIHSNVIHSFYAEKCKNPVHLTVDTSLQGGHMGLRAYKRIPICVMGGKTGSMFTPISVKMIFNEPETVGVKLLEHTISATNPERPKTVSHKLDIIQIYEACNELEENLYLVIKYVEDVIALKEATNNAVGRQLMNLIHSVPYLTPENFRKMFNKNINDLLTLITISIVVKTQLEITEKLDFMPAKK